MVGSAVRTATAWHVTLLERTRSVLGFIPKGLPLPEDVWRTRHTWFVRFLWLHALTLGGVAAINGHGLWKSLAVVAVLAACALLGGLDSGSRRFRASVVSFGYTMASGLLVHLSGGYIEMHFHYFVMVAFLALYQDWAPFLVSITFVGLQHGLMGALMPSSVYNHPDALAHPWKWAAVHVVFLGATATGCLIAWHTAERATDRLKQTLGEMQRATEELDRFFTLSLDLLCVAGFDGYFKRLNPSWERVLGYATEELLAKPWLDFIHPEDRDATVQVAQRQMASGESVTAFENRCRCKDGSYRWLVWTATPALEQGLIYATAHDITARKRAEEAQRRLAAIVESSDGAIISKTLEGIVDSWNRGAERLFGYTADEIVGKPITVLFSPDRMGEETLIIARIKQGERIEGFETVRRAKDGRLVDVSLTLSPIRNERGGTVGISKIARDITDQKKAQEAIKRANERLEAANKELEAFSYSVSHDLRTPVRHIQGFTKELQEEASASLSAEHRECLDVIVKAATRMGALIDDLLQFSRIGRTGMRVAPVNMGLAVQEVIKGLEPDTKGRQIEWRIGALPVVAGDAALLRHALANVIGNALKFTARREQAVIEIGASDGDPAHPSEAVVYVRDNGAGFDMRYADKLFGVFQRLHRADEYEGTGIGLANVKRIVQRHGGRVWAKGQVGVGATVFLALPTDLEPSQGGTHT